MYQHDEFNAPQLPVPEVLNVLNEIMPEDNLTKQDILNPKPDRIQLVYYKILLEFGTNAEFLTFLSADIAHSDHAETFGSLAQTHRLLKACRHVLQSINFNDNLTIMDLLEPEGKKTKKLLSAFSNYWLFCNDIFAEASLAKDEVLRKKVDRDAMAKDAEKLTKEIEELRKSNAEDSYKELNLQRVISTLTDELCKMQNDGHAVQHNIDKVKQEISNKEQKLKGEEKEGLNLLGQETAINGLLRQEDVNADLQKELGHLLEARNSEIFQDSEIEKHMKKDLAFLDDIKQIALQSDSFIQSLKATRLVSNEQRGSERQSDCLRKEIDACEAQLLSLKQTCKELSQIKTNFTYKWNKRKEAKENELKDLREAHLEKRQGLSQEEIVASEFKERICKLEEEFTSGKLRFKDMDECCEKHYAETLKFLTDKFQEINSDITKIGKFRKML